MLLSSPSGITGTETMSPKTPPQQDPRIAPKEMIVTRRKSALQKRQLRDKDRSMTAITQLLKAPKRYPQTPKKQKVTPKQKSTKKKTSSPVVVEDSPPKPNIQRRPRVKDRVWLKHKHNFKTVAKTNKRKMCSPHRELPPAAVSPPSNGASPKLEDDSSSLCDEDLMEILTCPSPVWWEDPPDDSYREEAICTRSPSPKIEIKSMVKIPTSKNLDAKFLKKKKKLESLMANIKNMKKIDNLADEDDSKSDNIDVDLMNDEMLSNLENMDIPIEPAIKVEKDDETNEVPNEITPKLDHNEINQIENVVPENMPPLQRNPMHSVDNNSTVTSFSDNKCDSTQDNDSVLDRNEIKINSDSPVLNEKENKDLDTISDTNIKFIDNVEDKELDDTSQLILDKIKKFFQEKEKNNKKEYITVYKIVDNEEKQEVKNDDQSKINYFYKKCKNVRKKTDTNKELNISENKTLALPNSEVKYCFKCSSIFETKECHYCAKSATKECVCDESHGERSDYSCDSCEKVAVVL